MVRKTKVKLDILTNIDMLLMLEKRFRGGICHSISWYAKANNNYIKDNDKDKESAHLKYCDVNSLYGWAMPQKFPANNFEWIEYTSQFNEGLIKNYDKESDEGCFFEVDIQYPEKFHDLHNDLPFLPERLKSEKAEKLVANLVDKTEYVIQIRNLKENIKSWIIFEKSS